MLNKKWYFSKTLGLNVIAILLLIVQSNTGFIFPVEYQALGVAILNALNRMITNSNITL
ncbi:hypothetical protein [Clostridium sp.]